METTTNTLDVRVMEPRLKHPAIFHGFDKLQKGESLTIINDHDPLPLFYQFQAERPDIFEWQYVEKGPVTWRVNITKTQAEGKTVADLLLENPKAANVFKKYHIDYCCKGSRLFEDACAEAGLDPKVLKDEISEASENPQFNMRAKDWSLDFLADYIINNHHQYVKDTIPNLLALSDKVKNVHGDHHPELLEIDQTVNLVAQELMSHLQKEEQMLFPAIKEMIKGEFSGKYPFSSISQPIQMMEEEHVDAGEGFEKIRALTNNYKVPQDACTSYRLLYDTLEAFESDLHQHVHLENNILFPKAIALEKQI